MKLALFAGLILALIGLAAVADAQVACGRYRSLPCSIHSC